MISFNKFWNEQEKEHGHIRSPANRFSKKAWDFRQSEIESLQSQLKQKDEEIERARLLMEDMQTAIYDIHEEEYRDKFNKWLEKNKG